MNDSTPGPDGYKKVGNGFLVTVGGQDRLTLYNEGQAKACGRAHQGG